MDPAIGASNDGTSAGDIGLARWIQAAVHGLDADVPERVETAHTAACRKVEISVLGAHEDGVAPLAPPRRSRFVPSGLPATSLRSPRQSPYQRSTAASTVKGDVSLTLCLLWFEAPS